MPEFAVCGAQRLLRDDDVRIIFGLTTSGPGMPAATLFARSGVMYIGAFTLLETVLGKPGSELMLRPIDSDAVVAKQFVPIVAKELGIRKIGIVLPNEDVSRSIVETYKPLLEKEGVAVAQVEYFQTDTADFAPLLRKFQNKGLDGMLVGTNDAMVEAIVRQSLEIGGLPKKFVYRGGSGAPGIKFAKDIDAFAWQIMTRDIEHTSDANVKAWTERYKAFTKKELSPSSYWALAYYDTMFMLARAMESAGTTTDLKAINAKMKESPYEGVRVMRFDKEGRSLSGVDVGVLKNGKVTSVRARAN
jgi:branched-chain amino acid transport system substrate-binding protein